MSSYERPEPGIVRNSNYAKQLLSFAGMKFGTISPTDIDAFIEIRGEVFIFIEAKFGDAEMPLGQRLALERLTDTIEYAGKKALLIIKQNILT